jgi:hypothetical protein
MSTDQEKPKFVSSIPNNKLEPVFIGRPETDALSGTGSSTEKKSSVYVPAFLKNKQEGVSVEKEVTKKPVQKKPQMNATEFPDLPSSKSKPSASVASAPTGRSSYLDMILKANANESVQTKETVDEPKKSVSSKGMLVLGRNMDNKKGIRSWAEEEEEELDYSQPIPCLDKYEEDDEAEEDDEFYEIDKYHRRH